MRLLSAAMAGLSVCLVSATAHAAIIMDYSHDSFFASNAVAQAALEAAASDISNVLNFSGTALNGSHDVITGVNGSTTATYDFNFQYTNPTTGGTESLSSIADLSGGGLAAGEIRVFVGVRPLTGTTLGQGGPGGTGADLGISGFVSEAAGAVAAANANASAAYGRGDGPVIGTLSGSLAGHPVTIETGPTIGNLWFDSDTDNNGLQDFDSWHFDHTMPVAAGKFDFYSVALHEILHAIGYGVSDSWSDLVSGTDWLGANVIALNGGSGAGLIDGDGAHVALGTMSTSLLDGSMQEVVMDPNITPATRKYLTAMDVAFLQDIGFASASAAVPEPGSFAFCLATGVCLLGRRYRRRRQTSSDAAA